MLSVKLTAYFASVKDGVPARGAQQMTVSAAQKRSLQTTYNQSPDNDCEAQGRAGVKRIIYDKDMAGRNKKGVKSKPE